MGSAAFQSHAPRLLTGTPTYDGNDPRALLADSRYGGFYTPYQFDASDWTPMYANGVLQTSGARQSLPLGAGQAGGSTPAEWMVGGGSETRRPARRRVIESSPMPKPGLAQNVAAS